MKITLTKLKKKMTIMTNIGKKFKSTNNNNNNLPTSRTAERYVHGQKIVTFHHWKQNCLEKYFPLNLRIFFLLLILTFSTIFWPLKTGLSGNTV